jgi:hypothetical protein
VSFGVELFSRSTNVAAKLSSSKISKLVLKDKRQYPKIKPFAKTALQLFIIQNTYSIDIYDKNSFTCCYILI